MAGCSIEGEKVRAKLYDFELVVERIIAAVEANRALAVPLILSARVDHYLKSEGGG